MNLLHLQGKLVAVLGYGLEGKATAKYLLSHGIKPVLFDQKPWQELTPPEQEEIKSLGINFIFGPGYLQELKGFDVVFRSPGIRIADVGSAIGRPSIGQPVAGPTERPAITSQTKWFFENCPAKIIGVTGTKGKGTTASLIHAILVGSAIGRPASIGQPVAGSTGKAYLTGNIGKTQPFEILDELKPNYLIVYELSSFQLQDLTMSPHIGVVLMTTSEHLDYHKDEQEYVRAKSAITKFQTAEDFAVVNADFENSLAIGKLGNGKKIYFSRQKELEEGCFVKGNEIVTKNIGGKNFQFSIFNFQLPGSHNLENICAAVCVAKILGVDDNTIRETITNFKGLEHRLEFVAEKKGIKYYNDSFSTTPETAIAAIDSFIEPEILILGGSDKGSDFNQLIGKIETSPQIKTLICVGPEGEKIARELNQRGHFRGKIQTGARNMADIISQAQMEANSGDVVLLSPACASFGMFKNYKDRGEQFKKTVLDL